MLRLRLGSVPSVQEDGKYLPARGLLYSFLVHEIAFFLVSIFSITGPKPQKLPDLVTMIDLKNDVLYLPLPELGASRPAPSRQSAQPAQNSSGRGLVYPGPQPIFSDFPNPTNRIQTLLQPSLKNPIVLPPPLSLPNLVQIPEYQPPPLPARPEQAVPLPSIQTSTAANLQSTATLPVKIPEANIPEAKRPPAPLQQAAAMPQIRYTNPATLSPNTLLLPQIPNADVQRPPAPVQQAVALAQIRETNPATLQQNSVMLPSQVPNANVQRPPALLQQAAALPQIRNTAAANVQQNASLPPQIPAAGASTPALPAPPPLPGATRGNESLLALSPVPATPDEIVRIPAGEARGRFAVSPQPNLAGDENEPPGRGTSGSRGSSNATSATPGDGTSGGKDGSGNAPSNTSAPGTGPAGASGRNEFPGVTILGAGSIVENGRVTRGPTSSPAAPISTSYGLTVLSTGASGGGLPQFGVFASSDQIHTVFLDMRRSMFDASPSWTFQYALLNPPSETAPVRPNQQGLVLPFPTTKDSPALPDNVVRRNLNKMVIVYGIVNTKGRFESLDVKQSPDSLLDGPIVAALSKWIFKPAEFNGESVPVKVLLGIPVSLP